MSITSFEAIHYRGIDGLSLQNMSRANLITGVNGIGKTALIEAIWLFVGRRNPRLLWNINVQRSDHPVIDPIAELSAGFVELQGRENGKRDEWKVQFEPLEQVERMPFDADDTEPLPVPLAGQLRTWINGQLIDEGDQSMHDTRRGAVLYKVPPRQRNKGINIIEGTSWHLEAPGAYLRRYSDMVRAGHKPALTNALSLILPRIKDLEILTDEAGKSYLSANTSTHTQLPLQALGGGVVRLFRLYLNFFTARNGMVLVDEVENGMHYSVLQDLWNLVRNAMHEWDVQFVATTHSAECIDAAMEVFEYEPDDLSIHKLYTDESGNVRATTFTGETLAGARDLNLEVR